MSLREIRFLYSNNNNPTNKPDICILRWLKSFVLNQRLTIDGQLFVDYQS